MFKKIITIAFLMPFFWQLSGCSCSKRPSPPVPTQPGLYIYPGAVDVDGKTVIQTGEINEGESGTTEMFFTIFLQPERADPVTVEYELDGAAVVAEAADFGYKTATADEDFTAVTRDTVTFEPGEIIKRISVQVKGDTLYERSETISLKLLNAAGADIKGETATGVIVNDDDEPIASISVTPDANLIEQNDEKRVLTVTLDKVSGIEARYKVGWTNNAASQSSDIADYRGDYVLFDTDGTEVLSTHEFTIPAGETTAELSLEVINDGLEEGSETFSLTLNALEGTDGFGPDVQIKKAGGANEKLDFTIAANDTITTVVAVSLNDSGILINQQTYAADASKQDASAGRDATANDSSNGAAGFHFTKLAADGTELPASATEWDCVKDETTGLLWEVKKTAAGIQNMSVSLTWYDPNPLTNGGNVGLESEESCDPVANATTCNTLYYTGVMNRQKLCGKTGWRVPTLEELRSLMDYGKNTSNSYAVDIDYFPNIIPTAKYWSSQTYPVNTESAWVMDFGIKNQPAMREKEIKKSDAQFVGIMVVNDTER